MVFNIIQSYINYYKLRQHQKILAHNLEDIENKLAEIKKFEAQGLATKNDVLRFELERSKMMLDAAELDNNRKIVNYNLNILLGLPDSTVIEEEDIGYRLGTDDPLESFMTLALKDRKELSELRYRSELADVSIKTTQDEKLPTASAEVTCISLILQGISFPKAAVTGSFYSGYKCRMDMKPL